MTKKTKRKYKFDLSKIKQKGPMDFSFIQVKELVPIKVEVLEKKVFRTLTGITIGKKNVNKITGEKFIYVGGKKKILKSGTKKN